MEGLMKMETEYKIRKCDCGENPIIKEFEVEEDEKYTFYMYYIECNICKKHTALNFIVDDAIKDWNDYLV